MKSEMKTSVFGGGVLHKGSKDAGSDITEMILANPCSSFYFKLEECLGEKNRNWKDCQPEVAALKLCNESQQRN